MPLVDPVRLERASSAIARTILDPNAWPEAMEEISSAAGATGAVLLQSDVRTSDVPRTPSVDEMIKFYFDQNWHEKDLRVRGIPLLLNGQAVITDEDCIGYDAMRRSAYYNEFIYRTGFESFAGIGFFSDAALWVLAIQRVKGEGFFEASDKRMLAGLSQRLTEAATLSKAIGQLSLSASTRALDCVAQAALAIDRRGVVISVNATAESLFDDDFRVHNGRLNVRDRVASANLEALKDRLRTVLDADPLPARPIVIRREAKASILLRVLPIGGPAKSAFIGARALLTLTELTPKTGPNPLDISSAFGLTPAEARLASLIVAGHSPEEAAGRLGISVATARNHLKSAFGKTGTSRQSGLVALLSRL